MRNRNFKLHCVYQDTVIMSSDSLAITKNSSTKTNIRAHYWPMALSFTARAESGSRVFRINFIRFLAGRRKRRLNQG